MEKPSEQSLYRDPDYVQGQIAALTAMFLGLAQTLGPDKDELLENCLKRIQVQRDVAMQYAVPESRLIGLDHAAESLREVLS